MTEKKDRKDMTFKDVWGFDLVPMDDLFVELFGPYAEFIYKYLRFGFSEELAAHPEEYIDNENAKENKKHMIAGLILEKFQIADSPFYE